MAQAAPGEEPADAVHWGALVRVIAFGIVAVALGVAIVLGQPLSIMHLGLVLVFGGLVPGALPAAVALVREARRGPGDAGGSGGKDAR